MRNIAALRLVESLALRGPALPSSAELRKSHARIRHDGRMSQKIRACISHAEHIRDYHGDVAISLERFTVHTSTEVRRHFSWLNMCVTACG